MIWEEDDEPLWPDQESFESTDPISFNSEDIDFELANTPLVRRWIEKVIQQEGGRLTYLNIIFCSDPYLHQMNVEYLQHDTYTDIITFPYQEPPRVEVDIFISIDRVRDNAHIYEATFEDELHRVIIHGVLHLCGYGDKVPAEQARMREKENEALALMGSLN